MGRSASNYERELRALLQGDREAVSGLARRLPPEERAPLLSVLEHPFLVVRAAGSLGFDLVALRREFAFPLEAKASASDTIRFSSASGRAAAQLAHHQAAVDRVGLIVLYAYRRVGLRAGDPWRVYRAPSAQPPNGSLGFLYRQLPIVESTREGNAVLRWDNGLPLVRFLELVRFVTDRGGPSGGPPP